MADKTSTRDDDVARGFVDEDFPQDEDKKPSPSFIPLPLPQLTDEPQTLPDCCLSLSFPLLRELHGRLPPAPHLTLSIGSGTGLVEGLLHALASSSSSPPHATLNLVSVEVAPSPNRYHAAHRTVPGTWALDPLAGEARAWVFVYPKQVALVREYMAAFSGEEGCAVETVVYIGPRRDWDDFRAAFEGFARDVEVWDEEKMEAVGGRAWECVAIVRPEKRRRSSPDS
ncbi:uncharacterized protein LY79DRAFT_587975 [Colletotrichum navitas]|uniref:Uncharacterized protein n=1 Tax=Colletotrichum navitas TaxID=681940 RepID=A0AAD8Q6D3_9PEZI|nr:uncharacterized protein LY79DRAFT_587975 [Colletotrichum navitas]KAK1596753.1 hypothetical protein LY79DRAFT_587975 [Colletotrichum navitas]